MYCLYYYFILNWNSWEQTLKTLIRCRWPDLAPNCLPPAHFRKEYVMTSHSWYCYASACFLIAFITTFFFEKKKVTSRLVSYKKRLSDFWTFSKLTALCYSTKSNSEPKATGPRQTNLVLIAYASSEGSGEPAHPRSLARTFAARSYKQWVKRNLQTESQIPSPSEWLGMRSSNLSWRNARRHKFAWRGSTSLAFGRT